MGKNKPQSYELYTGAPSCFYFEATHPICQNVVCAEMGESEGLGPLHSRESERRLPHNNLGQKDFSPNVKLIHKHCFVGARRQIERKRKGDKGSSVNVAPGQPSSRFALEIPENFPSTVR